MCLLLASPPVKHFGTQLRVPVAVVQDGQGLWRHVFHLQVDELRLFL